MSIFGCMFWLVFMKIALKCAYGGHSSKAVMPHIFPTGLFCRSAMSAAAKPAKKEDTPSLRILKAAERGDLELLKAALASGADLSSKDDGQNTPLHLAAYRGHVEVVQHLVSM